MSVEDQLIDLEIRFTHQGKVIATLDEVVREFAARVERLERQLTALQSQTPPPGNAGGTLDEPPPHY
jgi:uncharacterized coiled-coil protein SlyX